MNKIEDPFSRAFLCFRKTYECEILAKTLTSAVRPGMRISPNPKGFEVGLHVGLGIAEKLGNDKLGIAPKLGYTCEVIITKLIVTTIDLLSKQDLLNCSSDSRDVKGVLKQLENIYERPFSNNSTVTVISWRY